MSGKNKSRTKVGAKKTFELMFQNRDETEFLAALSFWSSHYPDVQVYYNDKSISTPANVTVRIVSDFVDNSSGSINDRSYSFVVQEV